MINKLAEELATKKQELKNLNEEVKSLERRLSDEYKDVIENEGQVKIETNKYKIRLVYTSRLDTNKIERYFPHSTHPEIYKNTLDTAAFKQHATPQQINEYSNTTTSWRVTEC